MQLVLEICWLTHGMLHWSIAVTFVVLVRAKHHGVDEELHKDVASNEEQKAKAQNGRQHAIQKEPAKKVRTLSGFNSITHQIPRADNPNYSGTFTDAGQESYLLPWGTKLWRVRAILVRRQLRIPRIDKELPAQNLAAVYCGNQQ